MYNNILRLNNATEGSDFLITRTVNVKPFEKLTICEMEAGAGYSQLRKVFLV